MLNRAIAVHCRKHKENKCPLWTNFGDFIIQAGGTYINHWT